MPCMADRWSTDLSMEDPGMDPNQCDASCATGPGAVGFQLHKLVVAGQATVACDHTHATPDIPSRAPNIHPWMSVSLSVCVSQSSQAEPSCFQDGKDFRVQGQEGVDSFTYRGRLRSLQDVCGTLVGHAALLLRDVTTHTAPRGDPFCVDATARGVTLLQVGRTSLRCHRSCCVAQRPLVGQT